MVRELSYADGGDKDYYSFVHDYFGIGKESPIWDEYELGKAWKPQCREIMANEISVVKIRMETSSYMKTVKDRRLSFTDKLAFFGMIKSFI